MNNGPHPGFGPAILAAILLAPLAAPGQGPLTISNPNWNITLTHFEYSDFLLDNTPGFEGREYLSGEWGAAVAYTAGGSAVSPKMELRVQWLEAKGNPLSRLDAVIDWEGFRPRLEQALAKPAKGPGGRPANDPIIGRRRNAAAIGLINTPLRTGDNELVFPLANGGQAEYEARPITD